MAGKNRKRQQASTSNEQGEIFNQLEQETEEINPASSALGANKLSRDDYPCVTLEVEPKRSSEFPSSSDNLRVSEGKGKYGSTKNRKKSAIEHDETTIQVIETTSCISKEWLERQPQVPTSAVTGGQAGQCVRTVAETSPMPDLFAQDEDGDTFLHIAVAQGDQPLTDFFIQRMKSRGIDIYNKLRQTPLHLAVITHQAYMVRKLIEGGADVNLMDRHGQTALHLACQAGDVNCVSAIREVTRSNRKIIRLELKNSQGLSVLHVATLNGNKHLIGTILDMGVNIDDQDSNSGRSPLHHAVEAGKYHVVEYLISRGADVNKVTFAGNTPLHTASGREMDDMAKLLLTHGANVNIANLEGDIPKVVRTSEQAKRQFQSKTTGGKRRKR